MKWTERFRRKPKNLLSQTHAASQLRQAIQRGAVRKDVEDREIERLIERVQAFEGSAEWAADPRGRAFVETIEDQLTDLFMLLPDAVLENKVTAETIASQIKAWGNLLRIFNSPMLEYDRVRRMVDERIGQSQGE